MIWHKMRTLHQTIPLFEIFVSQQYPINANLEH